MFLNIFCVYETRSKFEFSMERIGKPFMLICFDYNKQYNLSFEN